MWWKLLKLEGNAVSFVVAILIGLLSLGYSFYLIYSIGYWWVNLIILAIIGAIIYALKKKIL